MKGLNDLAQLTAGFELISAGEFKRDYFLEKIMENLVDPKDTQPADWAVLESAFY